MAIFVFDLLLVIALILYFFPFKNLIGDKIIEKLNAEGLAVTKLQIDSFDNKKTLISELSIGENSELKLKNIEVNYDVTEVIYGKVRALAIEEVSLSLVKKEGKFIIEGLEQVFAGPGGEKLDIDNILNKLPSSIKAKNLSISYREGEFSIASKIALDVEVDKERKSLDSTFSTKAFDVIGVPIEIKDPSLSGNMEIKNGLIASSILLTSSDKNLGFALNIKVDPKDLNNGKIQLSNLRVPFGGGVVSSNKITTSTNFSKPIPIKLEIRNVGIEKLLGNLSNQDIQGEGKLSGTIKLLYSLTGKFDVVSANLTGGNEGKIKVSPTLIPGDNDQVVMTRKVLENFQYNILELTMAGQANDKSQINMKVEGANPLYLDGKKVKLNINLSGDTIPLLKQSLLPMNDAKAYFDDGDKDDK